MVRFNSPWMMCRTVRTFPSIVFKEPLFKVSGDAGVIDRVVRFADENVKVKKGVHLQACQAVVFGALREKIKIEARLHSPYGVAAPKAFGAGPAWIRTRDQGIMSPLLYR
jgi:hypothetical protein